MSKENSEKTLDAALELGFLTKSQLETIQQDQQSSNQSSLEIAVRHGFLKSQQIETIKAFATPQDVAPGYRIDGIIGQGGVGVVYKATQLRLNRTVALKTINQHQLSRNELAPKRFEREAQIVGGLRHPNIVSAFDFGVHKDKLFLVMEFVDGIDAENLLKKKQRLLESHVWHIGLQVCHALNYANQDGIIHRDIKPANLILTTPPTGTQLPLGVPFVKIADFGLARLKDTPAGANITIEESISGTPYYMSAEQITAQELDHRSDIYSLGVSLWHLMTGTPPIDGTGPLDVISTKMKIEDEWLDETPEGMSQAGFEVLNKMCLHNAADRIDDYSELISQIEKVIPQLKDETPSETAEFKLSNDEIVLNTEKFIASPDVTLDSQQDIFTDSDSFDAKPSTYDDVIGPTVDLKALPADGQQVGGRRKFGRWPIVAFVAALIGLGSFLGLSDLSPFKSLLNSDGRTAWGAESDSSSRIRLEEFEGLPLFLFNGQNLNPRLRTLGKWVPAQGGEGENVLAGKGGYCNFNCVDASNQPLDNFAFTCGFRHNEADLIEFQLLHGEVDPEFKVSVTRSECTFWVGEEKVSSAELKQFDAESFGYHVIQIESQPEHWLVSVDSKVLGGVTKVAAASENSTVQLVVNGQGWAHFEQIQFRRFKSVAPDATVSN